MQLKSIPSCPITFTWERLQPPFGELYGSREPIRWIILLLVVFADTWNLLEGRTEVLTFKEICFNPFASLSVGTGQHIQTFSHISAQFLSLNLIKFILNSGNSLGSQSCSAPLCLDPISLVLHFASQGRVFIFLFFYFHLPSLEVIKARLDGALDNLVWCLIWWLATLPRAGGLELDDFWGPLQLIWIVSLYYSIFFQEQMLVCVWGHRCLGTYLLHEWGFKRTMPYLHHCFAWIFHPSVSVFLQCLDLSLNAMKWEFFKAYFFSSVLSLTN